MSAGGSDAPTARPSRAQASRGVGGELDASSRPTEVGSGLRIVTDDRITTIELARPHVRNALTLAMVRALHTALKSAVDDTACDVVVVTGAGDAFCSGLDLGEQAHQTDDDHRELLELMYVRLPYIMKSAPKPVIAAVNGAARAGGCTVAFACDLVIAAESASFGLPEIGVGLLPGYHLEYLPGVVGAARAFEFALGGQQLCAADAAAIGLVNRVVSDADWGRDVRDFIAGFANLPKVALALGKRHLHQHSGGLNRGTDAVELLMQLRRETRRDTARPAG